MSTYIDLCWSMLIYVDLCWFVMIYVDLLRYMLIWCTVLTLRPWHPQGSICWFMWIYIYIYRERERERERFMLIYADLFWFMSIYVDLWWFMLTYCDMLIWHTVLTLWPGNPPGICHAGGSFQICKYVCMHDDLCWLIVMYVDLAYCANVVALAPQG